MDSEREMWIRLGLEVTTHVIKYQEIIFPLFEKTGYYFFQLSRPASCSVRNNRGPLIRI